MEHSRKNSWKALRKKWKAVSPKERMKLAAKLGLRIVGIRKCLFLGGYREEEDLYQMQQDQKTYEHLCAEIQKKDFSFEQQDIPSDKYIALMTENLDTGGLEEVVRLLAEEYMARGILVRVFCAREGGRIERELAGKGIQTVVFHGEKESFIDYLEKHPPCLINTHYVQSFMKEMSELGIPVVEVIHNMYVFLTEKQLRAEHEKAQYISAYIAVSQKAKEVYQAKIPAAYGKEITVIGNCGKIMTNEKNDYRNNQTEMRKKYDIPQNAFVLACVGSVDARKNQVGILRAWDIVKRMGVPEACLVFVGKSTDAVYEKKVREVIEQRKLEDSVKILGQCNEIARLLDAVDAVIIDSYYEGWSMAATEALYKGLPILHADCGSGAELVAGGQNGYLTGMVIKNMLDMTAVQLNDAMQAGVNENIEETAAAMWDVMTNRADWAARRMEIRQYAIRNFSTEKMIAGYLEVYHKVIRKASDKK